MADIKFCSGKPDSSEWKRLIERSKQSTIFQSEKCYDLYKNALGFDTFCFYVLENNILVGLALGYIEKDGGFIMQFLSRRAIIHGGLLLADDASSNIVKTLCNGIVDELKKKTIYVEIRNYCNCEAYRKQIESTGFKYIDHLDIHVDTSDYQSMISNIYSNKKREIKLNLDLDVEIDLDPTLDDVISWYVILKTLYKKKIHTPLFPKSFFIKSFDRDMIKYILVKYKGNVIGGVMCIGDDNVLYEWFECGEKKGKINGSILATYAALKYASTNGYAMFDMMGAGRSGDSYGVRRFKSEFGGKIIELGRFVFICNKLLYKIGESGIWIMRKI